MRLMGKKKQLLEVLDPVWKRIQTEAKEAVKKEPLLGGSLHACILHHSSIEHALAYRIASKLASNAFVENKPYPLCLYSKANALLCRLVRLESL